MRFILSMTLRDMRAAWKRLIFFFVCVAIGVGAIVALRSVIQSVRLALAGEARTLIAADVIVQTQRPWEEETRALIDRRLEAAPGIERLESIETTTMVRPADERKVAAKMVELRGVQAGFPFYGVLTLEDGTAYSHELLRNNGALVRPELLTQLDLRVGDQILIGNGTFTIRGLIVNEPGRRMSTFTLGPRVIIDHADLLRIGLLSFGSRARYQMLLRVPEPQVDPLLATLRADLRTRFVNVRSFRGTEEDVGEDLLRVENYLSLVGFVILILGGIGVWSVTRVFVQQKIRSIAVLKCLGASTRQIFGTYLLQVLVLGGGGSLLGVAIAAAAIAAVPDDLSVVATQVTYGLTGSAIVQGVGVGLLVSLLFSLVPLLEVRAIKPLLLLRHEAGRRSAPTGRMADGAARFGRLPFVPGFVATGLERAGAWFQTLDWVKFWTVLLVGTALVAVASWQAASLKAGLYVCLGFAGVTLVLHLAGRALVRLITPLTIAPWFPLRHAVLNLSRPGNQTRVVLLAVGLGSFFVIGVRTIQANLLDEFSVELRADGPDMFLIDIQGDQREGLESFLAATPGITNTKLIPILRARVTGVEGREVNLDGVEDVRGRGSLGREYVVTYRNHLESNERILEGRFWTASATGPPEVSIEESISTRFRIGVGDTMRFDILGRVIEARVGSVRHVDWDDSRTGGFMFLFRPDALEAAPHSYIAVFRAPPDAALRARLQRDLVAKYPNVSAIDMREVLKTVERMLANATLAITVVGGIALLSGALILIGAVAMTKFQRIYEAAIFKTLGATTRSIATMLVLEYGALGTLAGAIGSLGGLVLSWALSTYLLEIDWSPAVRENVGGILVTAMIVGTVGVLSSLDVLRKKPLATLRAE
jgi:putative ABC transport system permease protein